MKATPTYTVVFHFERLSIHVDARWKRAHIIPKTPWGEAVTVTLEQLEQALLTIKAKRVEREHRLKDRGL